MRCRYIATGRVREDASEFACPRLQCMSKPFWLPHGSDLKRAPNCKGWPLPSEWREYVRWLVDAGMFRNEVDAIVNLVRRWKNGEPVPEIPRPVLPPLGKGPGTELKQIRSELGVSPTSGCNCEAVAQEMDLAWSVGRFNEHRATYLDHLQKSYNEADVLTKLIAWGNAKMQGKPCTLAGLLTLAIERSAAQA
jgi:hypothetical protein